ncbi:MAG: diguanylate cyclase [Candidatus Omnitrophica bacterium]|nr:diguanylate cyclase [Candidatus Omnitrophota bacterium]MDD5736957.1 diguanylate cyclase [Candidatus Omnitrophota bacterium]
MKLKETYINLAFSMFIAVMILLLSAGGAIEGMKLSGLDMLFRLRGSIQADPKIVIIEVTDSDILGIGRWPWKRSWHADMVSALSDLGAKYIYFDTMFSEPTTEDEDNAFEQVLQSSGRVYLPFTFLSQSVDLDTAFMPVEGLRSRIKDTGAMNIYADMDGTLRRLPLVFLTDRGLYPHIVLKISMDYMNASIKDVRPGNLILSSKKGDISLPLSGQNSMLINWTGKWEKSFRRYTFLEVLSGYKNYMASKDTSVKPGDFKDSICLIGVTARGIAEISPTPFQPESPRISAIANGVNEIISRRFLNMCPEWLGVTVLLLMTVIPAFFIFGEKPLRETGIVFLIAAVYSGSAALLFRKGIVMDISSHLTGLASACFSIGVYNFVRVSVERSHFRKMSITDGLTDLFNIKFFRTLLESEIAVAQRDQTKKFSVLMIDIDHFKQVNDTYGHQIGDLVLKEIADVLKGSVRSSDVVARYGGEEIIVLLRGDSFEDAANVSEKIRKACENHAFSDLHDKTFNVTISVGYSGFREGDSVDMIIKRADEALYNSKTGGRNRVSGL